MGSDREADKSRDLSESPFLGPLGVGRGLTIPPHDKPREYVTAPAWRSVEAFIQAGRSPVTPTIFGGRFVDGHHFEDENSRGGRFRAPEDYQRRREKRKRECIERGLLVGVDIRVPITDAYRFPFSEIEALGEVLESCRQMFYDAPHPSCAFYVLTEEAYCCLRGFTRHLGDLP